MYRAILTVIVSLTVLITSSFKINATDNEETTIVSYYHDKFNGRKTASGDVFDNSKLTAANRTLPFGTKVKLTNLRNGKSVTVTINDRGPFTKGRAFDVSKAAFEALADVRHGTAPVSYEVIEGDEQS
ncbi:MAG: septal ring lytic transglycosylase RlpA family protein [Chryseobacterium sp.]|nr:MAG: septal ring lytic transglycosylase RlpA family protein [Chryseobacterium sp.]